MSSASGSPPDSPSVPQASGFNAEALLQIAVDGYGLPIAEACRATVISHIENAARMATLLNELQLDNLQAGTPDPEMAPVFVAGRRQPPAAGQDQ